MEDPVIDNRTLLRTVIEQHEERLKEERQLFARLFSTDLLDIGTIKDITPEERTLLTEVIDGCLGDPRSEYRAPDGSTIILLNPIETAYALLRSSDGILLLPRYRLQRQDQEQISFNDGFGG